MEPIPKKAGLGLPKREAAEDMAGQSLKDGEAPRLFVVFWGSVASRLRVSGLSFGLRVLHVGSGSLGSEVGVGRRRFEEYKA